MPPEQEAAMEARYVVLCRDLSEVGAGGGGVGEGRRSGPTPRVSEAASPGNGMSSETVLFEMTPADTTERYAARLAPLPDVYPVFPEYDIELQAKCMRLVRARTDVPAPDVRWVELDPQWLGTPFLVMRRIDGDAPPDIPPYVFGGWVADATPETRAAMQSRTLDVLEQLHELTPANSDSRSSRAPATRRHRAPNSRSVTSAGTTTGRATAQSYPLIDAAFAWLEVHWPEEGETVLNWGDARVGNILYRDFAPSRSSTGRWRRSARRGRPGVDDLPARVLPRHGGRGSGCPDERLHAARWSSPSTKS